MCYPARQISLVIARSLKSATAFQRGFPMMMTAAGTVPPARVFVIGAGVAGLQAIATARRLGAIVSATDVRPAAKEEIKSLGATFVGVEDAETAGQTGAYAREMSDAFRQKQAELMATTVAKNDIIICTALVMGRKAPVIVTQPMVDSMRAGSVIIDLAAEAGGNCAATVPGESIRTPNGVTILGYNNWPGRIPVAASALYARNLLTFLTTFWDKDSGAPETAGDGRHRQRRHADPRRRHRAPEFPAPTGRLSVRRAQDEPATNWRMKRRASPTGATTLANPRADTDHRCVAKPWRRRSIHSSSCSPFS